MATYLYDISNLQLDQNTYASTSINSIDLRNVAWFSNSMDNSFNNCYNLTQVTNINPNVISMQNTYRNCTSLTSIPTIPNKVVSLKNSFCDCINLLDTPTIPNSVTDLSYAFVNCVNIKNTPDIHDNITNLYTTFKNCQNLVNVLSIPSSITSLAHTFEYCNKLINIPTLPESLTNMYSTFSYCNSIVDTPNIPNSVTNMSRSFFSCINLVNVNTLSNSVTDLSEAFSYCNKLIHVTEIPNSVVNLVQTFNGCTNLIEDIHIPSNQITNVYNCFGYTTATKNVYIPFYNLYTNKVNTITRNSFTTAGYDENGITHGVYLKNLTPVLSITTVPDTAKVVLTANEHVSYEKDWVVPTNTTVVWEVSAPGYITRSEPILINESKNLNIILAEGLVTLYVTPDPIQASVTLEAEGYETVTGTGEQHIAVLPGTVVTYTVELEDYETVTESKTVTTTFYITVELEENSEDWDFILDENNKATIIEYTGNISDPTVPDEVYKEEPEPTADQ